MMVIQDSATNVAGKSDADNNVSLDANHRDLVRFKSRHAPDFADLARPKIVNFADRAPDAVKKRFNAAHGSLTHTVLRN